MAAHDHDLSGGSVSVQCFRTKPPAHWPRWAKEWAGSRGSLTRHLVQQKAGFRVLLMAQGARGQRLEDRVLTGMPAGRRVKFRQVQLQLNGQAVVLAQTLMKPVAPQQDWPFWQSLGSRSLGSRLFYDPAVRRGQVFYFSLTGRESWLPQVCGNSDFEVSHARYARCARYTRASGLSPLWVVEVFLPSLRRFKIGSVE